MLKALNQPKKRKRQRKPWCKECRKRHYNVCRGLSMRVDEYIASIQHYSYGK